VQAGQSKPTGIATHADLINRAEGLYCSSKIYSRIRGDHADDVGKGKTTKRRKKKVSCPWAHYWERLKDKDRFRSAAAAALKKKSANKQVREAARAAAAAGADGGGDAAEEQAAVCDPAPAAAANVTAGQEEGGPPSSVDVNGSDGELWEGRPIGTTAAKQARADSVPDERTIGRVASAVQKLGDGTEQRTMMTEFSQTLMRETAMGAACWAHQERKMQEKEGIKVARDWRAATGGAPGEATDGAVRAPGTSSPAGLAACGSPVDAISASGKGAGAEYSQLIFAEGDGDVFLVPASRLPPVTFGGEAGVGADAASPPSAATASTIVRRSSSAAAGAHQGRHRWPPCLLLRLAPACLLLRLHPPRVSHLP